MAENTFNDLDWDQLMAFEKEKSQPLSLSDSDAKRFHYRTILYKMDQENYALPLIADPNSGVSFISDLLTEMSADGYLHIGTSAYEVTDKGKKELETMADQYHSLVEHYDVFGGVDLDESCFLEEGDDPDEKITIDGEAYDRFIDLRVAVMRFKDISPFDMVFLNLLRESRIATTDNWEFDMALGKGLYTEIEAIVNSAYNLEDLTGLGKENEDGEIPGSDILKDVIVAGNAVNQERKKANAQKEAQNAKAAQAQQAQVNQNDDYDDGDEYEEVVYEEVVETRPLFGGFSLFGGYSYDYVSHYDHYDDPFYVEPCWQRDYHRRWY